MQVLVEMEYHTLAAIVQVNMLTWLYFVKIVCITPNISSQMIKCGPCVMNEVMLANCYIACVNEIRAYYSINIVFLVNR